MEVLNDILGYPNRKIYQNTDFFSFSLDSVMLANFVTIKLRDKNLLDLGTGNGVIPLVLSLRTSKPIVGVEIQEPLVHLAKKSVDYNHLNNQISIYHVDMKKYISPETIEVYDVITCNPPYFKVNDKNFFNEQEENIKRARSLLPKELLDEIKEQQELKIKVEKQFKNDVIENHKKYKNIKSRAAQTAASLHIL